MDRIIVDKSFLEGNSPENLRASLGSYEVVVTYELLYEVGTDSRGLPPAFFLDRLSGLTVCQTYAVFKLMRLERRQEKTIGNIMDPEGTRGLRDCLKAPGTPLNIRIPNPISYLFEQEEIDGIREALDKMWQPRYDNIFTTARKAGDDTTLPDMYMKVFNQLSLESPGHVIANFYSMKEIPNDKWMLYQFNRLKNSLVFRWRFNGNKPDNLSNKKIENEFMDIHYAALLPWAHGIATGDDYLKETAQAFFPNKRIIE